MFDLTFGRCENSKPIMDFIPGFLSLKKENLGSAIQNGSAKNFEIKLFECLTKTVAFRIFIFVYAV